MIGNIRTIEHLSKGLLWRTTNFELITLSHVTCISAFECSTVLLFICSNKILKLHYLRV